MKDLILVRGLPGSGKSTLAKIIAGENGWVREADMFFLDVDGKYNFIPSKIKEAHAWCQEEVEFLMNLEYRVVVSNTFTQEWEMEKYNELAKTYGYTVHTIIVENRHGGLNLHGVPADKLDAMEKRFEMKLK
jgi:predicted kinase